MEKIVQDLEDFELPKKDSHIEKDDKSKEQISKLLFTLYIFCEENENYENLDTLRTKFIQFFNKECRSMKLNTKKTELILMFGGMPLKNSQISSGGVGKHSSAAGMKMFVLYCFS